jgi:hypothetical protein
MLKTNRQNRFTIVSLLIFSMLVVYGNIPLANAASLTDVKDTISDSDPGENATHTITFTTGLGLVATDYIEVTLDDDFGDITTGTCPASTTLATTTTTIRCTATDAINTGSKTIVLNSITNPSEGYYMVSIATKNASHVEKEASDIMVYTIQDVTLSATVNPILTFAIAGLDAGQSVNGIVTTATSTATTTPFGTLDIAASSTVGQRLTVSTNATDGYSISVFQDGELENAAGSKINSFYNAAEGTGSTSPDFWAAPLNTLNDPDTYGHMGLTTSDTADLTTFASSKYAGLSGTSTMEISVNHGAANGTGDGITDVAYTVEITALQEAGDYTNTLTYVCTAQY